MQIVICDVCLARFEGRDTFIAEKTVKFNHHWFGIPIERNLCNTCARRFFEIIENEIADRRKERDLDAGITPQEEKKC